MKMDNKNRKFGILHILGFCYLTGFVDTFLLPFVHKGSSPAVSKTTGLLRQGTPPALHIPAGLNTVPLPIVRAPLHQSAKTTTAQATRPQSPAVGGQQVPQVQPQDLSR